MKRTFNIVIEIDDETGVARIAGHVQADHIPVLFVGKMAGLFCKKANEVTEQLFQACSDGGSKQAFLAGYRQGFFGEPITATTRIRFDDLPGK